MDQLKFNVPLKVSINDLKIIPGIPKMTRIIPAKLFVNVVQTGRIRLISKIKLFEWSGY